MSPIVAVARLGSTTAWETPNDLYATSIAWGDRDGDGDPDLAVAIAGPLSDSGHRDLVWDDDRGSLSIAWTAPEDDGSGSIAWADRDGDGDLDLAIGNAASGLNVPDRVYDASNGTFALAWQAWDPDQVFGSASTGALEWGDADGDGDPDLAQARSGYYEFGYGWEGQGLGIYENTGPGFALRWSALPLARVSHVAWGDLDRDGDLDLVEAVVGGRSRIWRNDGNFAFTLVWSDPAANTDTLDVALGDLDGDGDLDLAFADGAGANRVFRNTGAGLALSWTSPQAEASSAVAWQDWDGDGDLDLAFANRGAPVRVYDNVGGGGFQLGWSAPVSEPSSDVAWADWDGDGDPDLAVANDPGPLRIYANGTSGARLVILPPDPGEAGSRTTLRVIGATPGATLRMFVAGARGQVGAPGCAGVSLGLAQRIPIADQPVADASGEAVFTVNIPATWDGRTGFAQVLEPSTCTVGPVFEDALPHLLRADGLAVTTLSGGAGAELGAAMALAGDQDGDGVADLLIGAPGENAVHLLAAHAGAATLAQTVTVTGVTAGDEAGTSVDAADLDGDGRWEALVGAPGNDLGGGGSGAAYLLDGPIGAGSLSGAAAVLVGEAASDEAGALVRFVPDATGDGVPDVLVGATGVAAPSSHAGAAYLLSGAALTGTVDLSTARMKVTGADYYDLLGQGGDAADLDGDGVVDLAVGAWGEETLTPFGGAAYVFDGPLSGTVSSSAADATLRGDVYTGDLGVAIDARGDLDDDGAPDLAIGASGGTEGGKVYVVPGTTAGGVAAAVARTVLAVNDQYEGFGGALRTADLDGDGASDLVVGAELADGLPIGGSHLGAVRVFFGPLSAGTVDAAAADVVLAGAVDDEGLGAAVAVPGDVDGDGRSDLAIGGADEVLVVPLP